MMTLSSYPNSIVLSTTNFGLKSLTTPSNSKKAIARPVMIRPVQSIVLEVGADSEMVDMSEIPFAFPQTVARLPSRGETRQFQHGANFDRPLASTWDTSRNVDGLVEVFGLNQEIAAELLARFRERSVRHESSPLTDAHAGCR